MLLLEASSWAPSVPLAAPPSAFGGCFVYMIQPKDELMSADATLPDKAASSFPLPIESRAFGRHVALATIIGYVFYPFLLCAEVNVPPTISIYNVPSSLHFKYMIKLLTT